jgi:hypothetical protein
VPTTPDRLLVEARLLCAWGHLLAAGAEEAQILLALARELGEDPLAAACREGHAAVVAHESLSFWVQVLLATPRQPELLVRAGELLAAEAERSWRRGWLWQKLKLLHEADASVGDGLGALAREARDHALTALAEGLYAAAKQGRKGADLRSALRAASGTLPPLEALALSRLDDEDARLSSVLETLAGIGDLPEAGPAPRPLENLAQAASETAAPIKRGLERVLSGIEGALGIGGAQTSERASLVRQAVEARRRQEEGPPDAGAGEPEEQEAPPRDAPPGGDEGDDPGPRLGKTIGDD